MMGKTEKLNKYITIGSNEEQISILGIRIGMAINFWGDKWLEEGKLKDLFPDLFSLPKQPDNSINSNFQRDAYRLTF